MDLNCNKFTQIAVTTSTCSRPKRINHSHPCVSNLKRKWFTVNSNGKKEKAAVCHKS